MIRIDLLGNVSTFCTGDSPVVLSAQQRILFSVGQGDERTWLTCDFDGKDAKQFSDGLNGSTQPSVSPDGKRLLMMPPPDKHGRSVPTVIDVDDFSRHPIPVGEGIWNNPVW